MAKTPSNMVNLGTEAPSFKLINTIDNKFVISNDCFNKNGTVIMFICNHCPFVIHVIDEIVKIVKTFENDITFIAISSNDVLNYPEDSPELMKKLANDKGFSFPYLFDDSQDVARKFDAACTPDFFLYDSDKKLRYRGQIDNSRPGNNIPVNGNDLRKAIECIINKKNIDINQKPSIGCNIKWKN
tara:strand:+ start:1092 stop:1646 length:555 start_codon:yes stop_codon:yes gene_type:complete